jgi:hypothetical protein
MSKLCPKCGETKPLDGFTLRQSGSRVGQPVAHCKACNVTALQERKQRDPTIYRRVEWPSKLKRLYGITVEDYYRMLDEQGGGCAVCGAKTPGMRHYSKNGRIEKFRVDHCHATGRVRGLLCNSCNRAIGLIRDDPEIASRIADYLT